MEDVLDEDTKKKIEALKSESLPSMDEIKGHKKDLDGLIQVL